MALGVCWLSVVLTMHAPAPGGVVHRTRPDDGTPATDETVTTADTMPAAVVADSEAATPSESEDVAPQDVEVIADLDDMINREENRLWTEDTAVY